MYATVNVDPSGHVIERCPRRRRRRRQRRSSGSPNAGQASSHQNVPPSSENVSRTFGFFRSHAHSLHFATDNIAGSVGEGAGMHEESRPRIPREEPDDAPVGAWFKLCRNQVDLTIKPRSSTRRRIPASTGSWEQPYCRSHCRSAN